DQLRHGGDAVEDERRAHRLGALVQRVLYGHDASPQNCLAPIRRWVSSTATACPDFHTMSQAALTTGTTSSARSARRQITPIASSTGCVACPIGICQGLPSPNSPRIDSSMSIGVGPFFT